MAICSEKLQTLYIFLLEISFFNMFIFFFVGFADVLARQVRIIDQEMSWQMSAKSVGKKLKENLQILYDVLKEKKL